jgi:hypothetical protein
MSRRTKQSAEGNKRMPPAGRSKLSLEFLLNELITMIEIGGNTRRYTMRMDYFCLSVQYEPHRIQEMTGRKQSAEGNNRMPPAAGGGRSKLSLEFLLNK